MPPIETDANKAKKAAEAKKAEEVKKDEGFDLKWLKNLKFRGSSPKTETVDGRKVKRWVPFERDLTAADVLSFKVNDDHVVIVTADGQKVKVALGDKK